MAQRLLIREKEITYKKHQKEAKQIRYLDMKDENTP